MTQVKERPILMSAPMVLGILNNSKSQTRRTTGLDFINENPGCWQRQWIPAKDGKHWLFTCGDDRVQVRCRYGVEGDRLWVKETYQMGFSIHVSDCGYLYRATDVGKRTHHGVYCYEKDGKYYDHYDKPFVWRPSIFMKRTASRILLEIVSVRVERLQDISFPDAVAEGIEVVDGTLDDSPVFKNYHPKAFNPVDGFGYPTNSYFSLWDSINGEDSHMANPWVWVVEFKRITP